MTKPKTIEALLDRLKEELQRDNQLGLETTDFQLVASLANAKHKEGTSILFMNDGNPARMISLTLAAIAYAFKRDHGEKEALDHLRALFTGMAETLLSVGQERFDNHCGHDINRIAAEVFSEYSTHTYTEETTTPEDVTQDEFDALLDQTLDSLQLNDSTTRNTLNGLYSDLGIIYNATRTKQ